ncbi:hypothetical protein BGZ94_005677 [Podila epigama]|nr:hypothetical protein BGZ94_005677 [Podila epigama]
MVNHPKTAYKDICDIELVDFLDVQPEQTLVAHTIWKEKPTVVIVIRRPGCQFCREEAKNFDSHRKTFEAMGMNMVCIVHEKEGSDVFQKDFWHGKVYHDPTKGFYKALGGGRLRTGGWEQLIRPSFWVNLVRNKRSGVKGNFEGDGSILGGLYVLHVGDQGIAYEHIEKVWGDIASPQKVLETCSKVTGVPVSEASLDEAAKQHENLHDRMQNSSIGQAKRGVVAAAGGESTVAETAAPSTAPVQTATI